MDNKHAACVGFFFFLVYLIKLIRNVSEIWTVVLFQQVHTMIKTNHLELQISWSIEGKLERITSFYFQI